MSENKMPKKRALEMFFSSPAAAGSATIMSMFVRGLRDARSVLGRNPDNGQIERPKSGELLGIIGYFALFDQIGSCFYPTGKTKEDLPAIKCALKHFSTLSEKDIDVLYALRNSFVHDYSLYNKPEKPQHIKYTKAFRLESREDDIVVTHPKNEWDGDFDHINSDNTTIVNMLAFANMAEMVMKKIIDLYKNDHLEIALQGGSDELAQRYMTMFSA